MKFRKRPVVIEAVIWTGDNFEEMEAHFGRPLCMSNGKLVIDTLEGTMTASVGDYIVKGVHGEFYPCKPDIFNLTYEKAE